ncbi:MAG: HD domain-containing protein [Spirochaetaceae bacterium]|jgi:HD superfamily phosphohydrolase|nr:HD domain-containing protein [Spirochaetaceae bacterium]
MSANVWSGLRDGYTEPIRDALWGHVYLTPALAELTRSAPFTRLGRIFQLGPAYIVYPGATHTRLAHSIGVYHLARRLLLNLAGRGADAWLSGSGVRSFLCAALLHDLGHFPYTHSLKELPLRSHESLTASLILDEPVKSLVGAAGADPFLAAAIVDTGMAESGGQGELGFYRKLLSGCMDPDKLDYLNRDARYCGVPYGAQDVDFILDRLYPDRERGVTVDSRGIPGVESVLFSKYLMYKTVYWHRQVRSATAMIKKAILSLLRSGGIAARELYGLDDQGLFVVLSRRDYPEAALVKRVRDGHLHSVIAEIPFDKAAHGRFLDTEGRYLYEERLASALCSRAGNAVRPEEIIIDVPEPISFETGLHVSGESRDFEESSTVFKPQTVKNFTASLRILRIFAPPSLEDRIKALDIAEMLDSL